MTIYRLEKYEGRSRHSTAYCRRPDIGSRTDARSWIGAGRVAVNGKVIQTPDHWVDLDGTESHSTASPCRSRRRSTSCSTSQQATHNVSRSRKPSDGIRPDPRSREWVSPVGRLDLDTSGLLLMTNDNDFADHVMSPEGKVPKTYLVKTNLHPTDEDLRAAPNRGRTE